MTITNLSGTSSKKSTQIRIVAVVKSQTSLAREAFVLRELNVCGLFASLCRVVQSCGHCRVESYHVWNLSSALGSLQNLGSFCVFFFFFCCVSMNDLDPLVKYTCLVITKSYQMACKCF